jgi:hypothetical protein
MFAPDDEYCGTIVGRYPGTTRQFFANFAAVTGTPRHGINPPDMPEFTLDWEPKCRCTHDYHSHPKDAINPYRPCAKVYCPCWRFRPMFEAKVSPYLPGMEVVDHACPMPARGKPR